MASARRPSTRPCITRASRRCSARPRPITPGSTRRSSCCLAGAVALLPYVPALLLWQGATFRRLSPRPAGADAARSAPAATGSGCCSPLAFPPVLINFGHGQNGLASAALLAARWPRCRDGPSLPACCSACSPTSRSLACSFRWRCCRRPLARDRRRRRHGRAAHDRHHRSSSASTSGTAFIVSSRFRARSARTRRHRLAQDAERVRRGAACGAAASRSLMRCRRGHARGRRCARLAVAQPRRFPLKAAALRSASLLATPFSLDYDLMLLAPAIAFLAADGLARGFAPWEKTLLAALWIVPLVARTVAGATLIPLAVPVDAAGFRPFAAPRHDAKPAPAQPVAFCAAPPKIATQRAGPTAAGFARERRPCS